MVRGRIDPPAGYREAPLPPDERLAEPETRYEVLDGEKVYVVPANEPHGTAHFGLDYILRAHVARGYIGASEMLTRTSPTKDMAPDASVYPEARDPVTGGRQLEELAFEVASTQSLKEVAARALDFTNRGVRRVFCLEVARQRVFEWDSQLGDWRMLSLGASITDPCLIRPLSVRALLDAAEQDDEVARALLAKKNRVLATALRAREKRGEKKGGKKALIEAIETAAERLGVELDEGRRTAISERSAGELNELLATLWQQRRWP